MVLSKKNFKRTAEILHDTNAPEPVVEKFADYFAEENPRFDRARFFEAVKTGKDTKRRKMERL